MSVCGVHAAEQGSEPDPEKQRRSIREYDGIMKIWENICNEMRRLSDNDAEVEKAIQWLNKKFKN